MFKSVNKIMKAPLRILNKFKCRLLKVVLIKREDLENVTGKGSPSGWPAAKGEAGRDKPCRFLAFPEQSRSKSGRG